MKLDYIYFPKYRKERGDALIKYRLNLNINILDDGIYVHSDSEDWFYLAVQDLVTKYDLSVSVKRGICGNNNGMPL